MQRRDVLMQLQSIIRVELEDESIRISDTTEIKDLADWDSAAHVRILVAIETHFDIVIDVEEYTTFTGLKGMIDCICGKLDGKYSADVGRADVAHRN